MNTARMKKKKDCTAAYRDLDIRLLLDFKKEYNEDLFAAHSNSRTAKTTTKFRKKMLAMIINSHGKERKEKKKWPNQKPRAIGIEIQRST